MTREEIIKAVRVHRDQFSSCDKCPLNNEIGCVDTLTKEIIDFLLKDEEDADKEV